MGVFTREGLRKSGNVADWSQITSIPQRVIELAALGDPGGLRWVIWNDATNEIDYLEALAEFVEYDNAGSGLTATNVQDALDEIYAAIASQGVFAGYIASGGASGQLPSGWSVASISAGVYEVTHNLGLASGNDLSVVPTVIANDDRFAVIGNAPGTNAFRIGIVDVGAGNVDDDVFFLAKLNV